jgi:signal transduction histidine kinase
MIDSNGKLISVHSLILDITNRKQAEDSLSESYEFNKSLLQAIPFGMHIIDEHGNVLFVNEILERTFGTNTKGKKCWTLFKDKCNCPGCPLLSDIGIGKTIITDSYDIFEGRIFQISHTGMLFNGKKAILEIFQDITERKRIEAELINAKEKAEESDQLKTSFLANMSHEIRTPLNSIIGFSEMLTDPDYDPTQQFHIARIIHSSGNNLLTIINNILDISKIEAGQVQIHKKLFSVNKLLAEIEKDYLFKSIEKGIDFIVDVPGSEEEVLILSDEAKVRQILDNFISNSLKFTKKGYIRIGYTTYDATIEFMVKDSGIGIPVEFHQKIFEHFRQVEAVNTRTHGGNGLGLAISKGLVNCLGGEIWMESEKGKGSAFYFSIPVH